MTWQFVNRLSDGSGSHLWNYLTLRECLAVVAIVIAGFWWWSGVSDWWSRRRRLIEFASTLPGPRALPIIGSALRFAGKPEDSLSRIAEMCTSYPSPCRVWLGPKLFIVVTEPKDFEVILGSNKAAYKDSVYRFMEPFVGQGLVSGSGPKHRSHRKTIMPMLNAKSLSIYQKCFDRHARTCADLLEKEVDAGEFNISPYMSLCSVDIMLDTIMGASGTTRNEDHNDLVHWNERVYEIVHIRMVKVWLYWDKIFYNTQLGREQNKAMDFIHTFTENVVARKKEEHLALEREATDDERPRLMMLEQLISHSVKTGDMNDVELRDEIYTLFTASQDTTAVIASFAFMMMAMHPDTQKKAREEVNEVVGNDEVKEEHLPNLKYVEMVIRETVRLFPIAPLMVRQLTGDIKLESCTLPEGCSVVMVPFVTHRNPKYWNEPEKFIPERFLPENSVGRHQFASVPFSGGPRGCIGQKFALMCLKTMIANVIRRYHLSSTLKLEDLRIKTDISIRSQSGYRVSLTRINRTNP